MGTYIFLCLVVYAVWIHFVLSLFKRSLRIIGTLQRARLVAGIFAVLLTPGIAAVHSFIPFPAGLSALFWSMGLPEYWPLLLANIACVAAFFGLLAYVAGRYYTTKPPSAIPEGGSGT